MTQDIWAESQLITLHANDFQNKAQTPQTQTTSTSTPAMPFQEHRRWETGINWKSTLNNLRLLIQSFIFWCLLQPEITYQN